MSLTKVIQYSPELIHDLDKEEKDYPIDPMVLAILNGVKKTKVEMGPAARSGGGGGNGAHQHHRGARTYHGGHAGQHGAHPTGVHAGGGNGGHGGGTRHRGGPKYAGSYPHVGSGSFRGGAGAGRGTYATRSGGQGGSGVSGGGNGAARKKLYVEPTAFSNDRMVSDVRNILGKLSSENAPTITSQLLKLQLDKEQCLEDVAGVLHESAINGVFIVDYYVSIFLSIAKAFPKVIPSLNRRILREISDPETFAEESDTLTETCEQKAERWQISNALLFAELYKRGVYSDDLLKRVLRLFLQRTSAATPTGQFPLKVLVEFLPAIMSKIVERMKSSQNPLDIKDVQGKLVEISQDKTYPGPVRFPVMTLVKQWQDSLDGVTM